MRVANTMCSLANLADFVNSVDWGILLQDVDHVATRRSQQLGNVV